MTDRISEIRARCNAATPGPWMATWGLDARAMVLSHADKTFDVRLEGHSDAEFIAHARDDIPYLLSQLAERDKEIERLRAEQREKDAASKPPKGGEAK